MADAAPLITTTWHGKPLYVCPHCGTSRFTLAALERHLFARHGIDPVAPAPQVAATAASSEPASTPDATTPTPEPAAVTQAVAQGTALVEEA